MADFLDTENLDFNTLKSSLKTYLKNQDIFRDIDYEASNINVLLDVLSYNSYLNAFYLNMVGNENFMDSAVLKDTVVSHAKELNYIPRSRTSAKANIGITVNINNPSLREVVIPKYSMFTTSGIITSNNNITNYTFLNRDNIILQRLNATSFSGNSDIYEGTYVKEYYTVTGEADQRYVLSNKNVDTQSIKVTVQASNTNTSNNIYTNATSLYGLDTDSTVYFTQSYLDDKYEILFGDGVFGKLPVSPNLVTIEYMVTAGEEANGCKLFQFKGRQRYNFNISTIEKANSGSERETIKSIKFRAPRHFQTQGRAVTSEDYKILVKNNFNDISAVNVYGGEELDEPQYGKVFVSASTTTGEVLSNNRKVEILEFLKLRSIMSINSEFIDPNYLNLMVKTKVVYDPTLTNITENELVTNIRNGIVSYNLSNLLDFDKDFRYSKFIASIDDVDNSFISNSTDVTMIKEYNPLLGVNLIFTLEFKNEIMKDDISDSRLLTNEFTFYSSEFTYNGRPAYFGEDGVGKIFIYEYTEQGRKVLNSDCGTINYDLGKININNVVIDNYVGSAVKFYGVPKNKDIFVLRNTIIRIDSDLIDVSIERV
jgi:hypothetical protein